MAMAICEICGREMPVVNSLHLRTHRVRLSEYLAMFPAAVLYSEDTRETMSRNIKKAWDNPDSGFHGRKDIWKTRRERGSVSGSLKGKTYEEIYGEEEAERHRKIARDPNTWRGFKLSSEQARKYSLMAWDTPEKARRNFKAQQRKPSVPEILFAERLNKEFPNTWKYVGDGQVWIARANPDFLNINGKKLLIETYTPYFKQKDYGSVDAYIEQRGAHFLMYGFKTLFLNLYEKDWDLLIEKVRVFSEGGSR